MQQLGAKPVDLSKMEIRVGDTVVQPENNTNKMPISPQLIASTDSLEINVNYGISSMNGTTNAGFYAAVWGPVPFSFGPVPPERYSIYHLKRR